MEEDKHKQLETAGRVEVRVITGQNTVVIGEAIITLTLVPGPKNEAGMLEERIMGDMSLRAINKDAERHLRKFLEASNTAHYIGLRARLREMAENGNAAAKGLLQQHSNAFSPLDAEEQAEFRRIMQGLELPPAAGRKETPQDGAEPESGS